MKYLIVTAGILLSLSSPALELKLVGADALKAGENTIEFKVVDAQKKKELGPKDLLNTHTKRLHFIAYDAALKEFFHEHPEYDGKVWKTKITIPVDGSYRLWAQGKTKQGDEFSITTTMIIAGGKPAWPVAALGDQRKAEDRGTILELENTPVKANENTMVNFTITRQDGQPAKITPYLGAFAHVIAVSPDGKDLIHVHPMEGKKPNIGMIHATFPTGGDYRIWVEFNDAKVLKRIPLAVSVK